VHDGEDSNALAATGQNHRPLSAAMFHRRKPEVGAECVSSARSGLSGARPVAGVSTAMARNCMAFAGAARPRRALKNLGILLFVSYFW